MIKKDKGRKKEMDRNDTCWGGSGKKYKKCHLPFDEKLHHRIIEFIEKEQKYSQYEKYFHTNMNKLKNLEDYITSNFSDGFLKYFIKNRRIETFEEGKLIKENIIQKQS